MDKLVEIARRRVRDVGYINSIDLAGSARGLIAMAHGKKNGISQR